MVIVLSQPKRVGFECHGSRSYTLLDQLQAGRLKREAQRREPALNLPPDKKAPPSIIVSLEHTQLGSIL